MSCHICRVALVFILMIPPFIISGCSSGQPQLPENFDLQGHRGAMGLKPENTLPGFFKAVELGVNTIEFDLAVSREHKLVISHEPWFRSNICLDTDGSAIPEDQQRSYRLYEMNYEDIMAYDCGSLTHPSHPGQRNMFAVKPLMTEALAAVDEYAANEGFPPVRYNIEIKSNPAWDGTLTPAPDVFARLVYEELMELQETLEQDIFRRINVQSFDPRPLIEFRKIAQSVPIAILTSTEQSVEEHLEYFGFLPEIYSPNYGILTEEHVERAHEHGMRVIPWTVNRKEDMEKMIRLGVDGLITDYPDRFIELFPHHKNIAGR